MRVNSPRLDPARPRPHRPASKALLFRPGSRYETIWRMKLKLGHFLSRAQRLLRSEARAYEQAGALIRRRAWQAAERCARLGRNNDVQRNKSLKEFLAFFAVVTVNELGIKLGTRSNEELREVYHRLVAAIAEGPDPDPALAKHRVTINGLIRYKKSGFDHWFYGYWNADLEGMRISLRDLKRLEEESIDGPTGDYGGDASLILLVRLARLENAQGVLPARPAVLAYEAIIRDESDAFLRELKQAVACCRRS